MASSGKKKTTFAKLARESRLRERRQDKAARKEARRAAAVGGSHGLDRPGPFRAPEPPDGVGEAVPDPDA